MRVTVLLIASAATAMLCVSAHAADLSVSRGNASIDTGAGFRPSTADAHVLPGARILLSPNAVASIAYPDGCRQKLAAGRVWHVHSKSPCEFEHQRSALGGPGSLKDGGWTQEVRPYQSAGGSAPASAAVEPVLEPYSAGLAGNSAGLPAGLVAGGFAVVVGGAVAAAITLAEDSPASP